MDISFYPAALLSLPLSFLLLIALMVPVLLHAKERERFRVESAGPSASENEISKIIILNYIGPLLLIFGGSLVIFALFSAIESVSPNSAAISICDSYGVEYDWRANESAVEKVEHALFEGNGEYVLSADVNSSTNNDATVNTIVMTLEEQMNNGFFGESKYKVDVYDVDATGAMTKREPVAI